MAVEGSKGRGSLWVRSVTRNGRRQLYGTLTTRDGQVDLSQCNR
jgi:hypothetical protein